MEWEGNKIADYHLQFIYYYHYYYYHYYYYYYYYYLRYGTAALEEL